MFVVFWINGGGGSSGGVAVELKRGWHILIFEGRGLSWKRINIGFGFEGIYLKC